MKKLCCGFLAFLLLHFSVLAEESSLSALSTLELRQQLVSMQEALASSVSGNLRDVNYRLCEILGENGLTAMPLSGEAAGEDRFFPGDSYVFSDYTYGSRSISLDASDRRRAFRRCV